MAEDNRQAQEGVDSSGATDEVSWTITTEEGEVKVKGPDAEVWGDPSERPVAASDAGSGGLEIGEIQGEGDEQVKGPGEEWRERYDTGEEGSAG